MSESCSTPQLSTRPDAQIVPTPAVQPAEVKTRCACVDSDHCRRNRVASGAIGGGTSASEPMSQTREEASYHECLPGERRTSIRRYHVDIKFRYDGLAPEDRNLKAAKG